jgi:hypothetical protein
VSRNWQSAFHAELDDTERAHLFNRAKPTPTRPGTRPTTQPERIRPGLQLLLDLMSHVPAMIQGRRMDILATNQLGEALYLGFGADATQPRNMARFVFLDPPSPGAVRRLGTIRPRLRRHAALFRRPLPRRPTPQRTDRRLSVRSPEFRRWWGHNVRKHSTGTKHFHHPIVGALTVGFESLHVGDNLDLNFVTYTAEPNSPSAQALELLAS